MAHPYSAYWADRESPKSVTEPDEFHGGSELAVSCTQTALKAGEQRRLVARWCEALPTLGAVTHLWFQSRVPQELLDAACRMPNLVGLFIKWSGIRSIESLPALRKLTALHIGSSTGIRSIEPLVLMKGLRHLSLENIKRVKDLAPLARLQGLRQLSTIGSFPDTHWEVETLEPMGKLASLEYLNLAMLRPKSKSLRPLGSLSTLRFLGLDNRLPMAEYAWLSRRLPHTECRRFAPYVHLGDSWGIECRKCKSSKNMVQVTGKGGPFLCEKCDSARLSKYVDAFKVAANAP